MAKLTRQQSTPKVYLTPEGFTESQTELEFLKTTKRVQIADRIRLARELGDTMENAEYDAALDEQLLVENRIIDLENVIKNAKIINETPGIDCVVIGSTVKLEMGGDIDEFTIVGKIEANPSKKKISNESPLGAALLGTKIGDIVEVISPTLHYKCKVLQIR